MLGCTVAGIKVGIGLAYYNAYVNARIHYDDDDNPDTITLQAAYNTVGMNADGHVDYQMEGVRKSDRSGWAERDNRKAIPHDDPPGPALSEGYNTDTDYDGQGNTVVLTAKEDALVYAYIDGTLTADATIVGRKHQIEWDADDREFSCFLETRNTDGDWERNPDEEECMPSP